MGKYLLMCAAMLLLGSSVQARPRSVQLSYDGPCGSGKTAFCARYVADNYQAANLVIWFEEDFPRDSVMWRKVTIRYHQVAFTSQQWDTLVKLMRRDGLPTDRGMPIERYLRRHWFRTTADDVTYCTPICFPSPDQRPFKKTTRRR